MICTNRQNLSLVAIWIHETQFEFNTSVQKYPRGVQLGWNLVPDNVTEPTTTEASFCNNKKDNMQRIQVQNNVSTWITDTRNKNMWRTTEAGYCLIAYTKSYLSLKSGGFAFNIFFIYTPLCTHTQTRLNSTHSLPECLLVSRAITLHHLLITSQCSWPNTHIWPLAKPWTLNTLFTTHTHIPRWSDPSSAARGDFSCRYQPGWNI